MDLNGKKVSNARHYILNAINVCDSYVLLLKEDKKQGKNGSAFLLGRDKTIEILRNISSRCKMILDELNLAIEGGKDDREDNK